MGLRSPIVLDADQEVARAFGAHGTPMAVLIDPDGKIASPVAAGAAGVLELTGAKPPLITAEAV